MQQHTWSVNTLRSKIKYSDPLILNDLSAYQVVRTVDVVCLIGYDPRKYFSMFFLLPDMNILADSKHVVAGGNNTVVDRNGTVDRHSNKGGDHIPVS